MTAKMMLVRIGYWVTFRLGLYRAWSWIYRRTWGKKYRHVDVELVDSLDDIRAKCRALTWNRDDFRELWDAVAWPGRGEAFFQKVASGGVQPGGAFDCDDFATWAAAMANPQRFRAAVLNVVWLKDGKVTGHNVALVEPLAPVFADVRELYHLGNWGNLGPFCDLSDAVASIAGDPRVVVGWAIFDPWDLRVSARGYGTPQEGTQPWTVRGPLPPMHGRCRSTIDDGSNR